MAPAFGLTWTANNAAPLLRRAAAAARTDTELETAIVELEASNDAAGAATADKQVLRIGA